MSYAIQTEHLTKKFGHDLVVNDLNFEVPSGHIFAFLGPNGAGKTTTIKMLVNILQPTRGRALLLGTEAKHLKPSHFTQIGYVSENQDMPLWMTVQQFLKYCQSMYPQWDENFCRKLLAQFELPLNKKLSQLSRGMKMKAAMISSLAYHPKLLILDEPLSGLDPLVREELSQGILEATAKEGWSIFISSHDIEEVERLADIIGFINQGQLILSEDIEHLQNRFRRCEVILSEPLGSQLKFPKDWVLPEQNGRAVHFTMTEYAEQSSEQTIRALLPSCVDVNVKTLSLREIFLVLAKQFRITRENL